tara:strand:+ start:1083 stop:2018 length:936 start_codon:yes stop_codon:yes gene_type:complete
MAFNPEDFQFESITPPDKHKPILEWNALSRLIVVRVKDSDGEYSYHAAKLTEAVNNNLLKNLPDEWTNDNDRIVDFSIYDDGDYILDKEKMKFDFATKKAKYIRYNYGEMSEGEIKELFNVLKAAIEVQRVDAEIEKSREIVTMAQSETYLNRIDLERQAIKERLLEKSAWSQLADAEEVFDGEIELWTKYRAYLRDNLKRPEDFDDLLDYLVWDAGFMWPQTPHQYHANDPEHATEYLSDADQFMKNVEGTGRFAVESLYGEVEKAAIIEKKRLQEGIPMPKQIWDKIQSYHLTDGLNGINVDNLRLTGE